MAAILPNVIELNVGGQLFTTRLATLTSDPDSMLAAMFSGRHLLDRDSQGRIFIDRDGSLFQHVLTFLRDGSLPPAAVRAAVLREAQYFQVRALMEALQTASGKIAEDKVKADILSNFPKYDEVKRHLVSRAVEKASKSRSLFDVNVTLLVYDEVTDNMYEVSSVHFNKRTRREFKRHGQNVVSSFESSSVVILDLSDLGLDESELMDVHSEVLPSFMESVGTLIAGDLVDEGFKVTFDADPTNPEFKNGWCIRDEKYYFCEEEVHFMFTFLPFPLPSILTANSRAAIRMNLLY